MSEKKLKKIRFCRNSNFIRESTESAVRGCSSVNSQENTSGDVLL